MTLKHQMTGLLFAMIKKCFQKRETERKIDEMKVTTNFMWKKKSKHNFIFIFYLTPQ